MVYISIGGITPRGLLTRPRFYFHTFRIYRQAKRHPGCLDVKLTRSRGLFFAFSVWTDQASMQDFARVGAHKIAFAKREALLVKFDNLSFQATEAPSVKDAIKKWFDQ